MNIEMTRLYEAARLARGITGKSALARALSVAPQNIGVWEERGISRAGLLAAQRMLGCSPVWLVDGIEPQFVTDPAASASEITTTLRVGVVCHSLPPAFQARLLEFATDLHDVYLTGLENLSKAKEKVAVLEQKYPQVNLNRKF